MCGATRYDELSRSAREAQVMPVDATMEPSDAMQDQYLQGCLQNLLPRDEPYEIDVKAIYRVSQRVGHRQSDGAGAGFTTGRGGSGFIRC